MRNALIEATGSYAPEWVLPKQYFNDLLGEDVDTWLQENLTIKERRWCRENESTADLCLAAAKRALTFELTRNSNCTYEPYDNHQT